MASSTSTHQAEPHFHATDSSGDALPCGQAVLARLRGIGHTELGILVKGAVCLCGALFAGGVGTGRLVALQQGAESTWAVRCSRRREGREAVPRSRTAHKGAPLCTVGRARRVPEKSAGAIERIRVRPSPRTGRLQSTCRGGRRYLSHGWRRSLAGDRSTHCVKSVREEHAGNCFPEKAWSAAKLQPCIPAGVSSALHSAQSHACAS